MKLISIIIHVSALRRIGSHNPMGSTVKVTETYDIRFSNHRTVIFEIAVQRKLASLARPHTTAILAGRHMIKESVVFARGI